jgi:predicted nucleic acid-binding protein
LRRPRARELSILSDWQSFTQSWHIRTVGLSLVAQHAAGLMADTGLSSLDAIHLATALHVGAGIVSHDRGLLRVAEGYTTAITMRGA